MRAFHLAEPVDLAISMFDANDALLTNADQVQLLRTVAQNLTPHGVFVIDMSPPQEVGIQHYPLYEYAAERDGIAVQLLYGVNRPRVDPLTSVARVEVELRVKEGETEHVYRDSADERMLTPQEIALIAELSQVLRLVGWYGDFDFDQPLDNSPPVSHALAVLQKH
jgi:hypothetical protein